MQKFLEFLTWFNFCVKVTLKKRFSFAKSIKMSIFAVSNHKRKENMLLNLYIGSHAIDSIKMTPTDTCCLSFKKAMYGHIICLTMVKYYVNADIWRFVDNVHTSNGTFLYECPTTRMSESEKTTAMKYMAWWLLHFTEVKCKERLLKLMEQKKPLKQ